MKGLIDDVIKEDKSNGISPPPKKINCRTMENLGARKSGHVGVQ